MMEISTGQEWRYKNRPNDSNSTLVIGSLETHEEMGEIVHITVKNVKVINPIAIDGFATHLQHIPISKEALEVSLIKVVSENEVADGVEQGIEEWRKNNGGVFSWSVAKAVQAIEDILNQGEEVKG